MEGDSLRGDDASTFCVQSSTPIISHEDTSNQ